MGAWRAAVFAFAAAWILPAAAQEFVRIGNRLTAGHFLHIERGPIQSGAIQPTWWSAQWRLEPAAGGAVRIRNRWKNEYLQVSRGETEWTVEPITGSPYVRLRSRARSGEYLHLERGILQTGAMRADSPSGHWVISAHWPVMVSVPGATRSTAAAACLTASAPGARAGALARSIGNAIGPTRASS